LIRKSFPDQNKLEIQRKVKEMWKIARTDNSSVPALKPKLNKKHQETAFLMFESDFRLECLKQEIDEPKNLREMTINLWESLDDSSI
jgi:hypothetical protein